MSIAWTTIIFMLLSLPGFLFVFAFYAHSRSSRDATPKSQLAELVVVIGIAFVLHSSAFLVFFREPSVSGGVPNILEIVTIFDPASPPCQANALLCQPLHAIATHPSMVKTVIWYFWCMAAIGYVLGALMIFLIERLLRIPVRFLHGWAYQSFLGWRSPQTYATAITGMRDGSAVVAYRGRIFEISLNRDRNVEVLVLQNPTKTVFTIDHTNGDFAPPVGVTWRPITPPERDVGHATKLKDFLVINGSQISNLFTERVAPFAGGTVTMGDSRLDVKVAELEALSERSLPGRNHTD